MQSTGAVRRIDDLGRIVIPKATRERMDIKEGEVMEIFIDGDKIVLKKYQVTVADIKADLTMDCSINEILEDYDNIPLCTIIQAVTEYVNEKRNEK